MLGYKLRRRKRAFERLCTATSVLTHSLCSRKRPPIHSRTKELKAEAVSREEAEDAYFAALPERERAQVLVR
jgi:hypothetical protein